VLFTDVTGYTALSEQLGEEALFALMDDLYELFIHEVHRYEGTVNELTGDGIGHCSRASESWRAFACLM
jgi:class 3 adenylate cyclase